MTGVGECGCDCVGREGGKWGGRGKEERGEHCFIVSSVDGEQAVRPGMRGGHQMSIDPVRGKKTMHVANHHILSQISLLSLSSSSSRPLLPFSSSPSPLSLLLSSPSPFLLLSPLSSLFQPELLYLYGGWDGSHDLGDLWQFNVRRSHWTCLCQDTSLVVRLWVTGVLKTVVDYCTTLLLSGRVVLLLVPATRCVWMWRVSYCMSSDATWILPQEHSSEIVHTVLPFL